ncbi:choice-of-anchor E domain-containing protein [Duganella qianjiadongensis]|uniref:choice-of-anchor E domain-containing protein n=1 Tax=Duganella qianjiadongensis TaxID=2692176 RepID=UPI001E3A86BF|nr:choice-of-anchor E domain-containing protein [Duganella qianjiadongensis]
MKLNKITSAVLVAASLMAGAAHADTLVYDLSKIDSTKVDLVNVLMTFQGFNPAKGTLTGVSLDIYSEVDATVTLTNKNTTDRTLNVSVPASLKLVAPGATLSTSATLLNTALSVAGKTSAGNGVATESEKYTLHASTNYSGADLALFNTAGTLSSALSVAASTTLNEDRVKAVYSNFANGYGHVTYTFTAAPVPEPETYGMLLAGLAMLGFIAKRNKRSA